MENREQEIRQDREDLIEGRNAVAEAIRAGRTIDKIFVARGDTDRTLARILAKARENGIVVTECDRRKLDSLSATGAHQGIIAQAAMREYASIEDILERAAAKKMIGAGTDYLMVRAKDSEPPEFIGILTKVDIVKSLCAENSNPDTDTVDQFMSRRMVVANVGDDVEYVMNVMVRHKISHLPVIEGKSIAGVISRNDILAALNVKQDIELQWLSDYSGAIPKATVY